MTSRKRLNTENEGGNYFTSPARDVEFIPSGCEILNCVLGGGWAQERIINVVGDSAAGKSLLCIEAIANFAQKYPNGRIWYNEVEAAFDTGYAEALGMPIDRVEFVNGCYTVEDFYEDLKSKIEKTEEKGLYILDSLDALSDKAELERNFDEGTYGMGKPKQMGKLFRQLVQHLKHGKITVIIVSQERDKINIAFGKKTTRSGGRALDFYCSQILWLAKKETLKKIIRKVERPVGLKVRAKLEKSKVGLPYRHCDFSIRFGYGIDELEANMNWLKDVGRLSDVGVELDKYLKAKLKEINALPDEEFEKTNEQIRNTVRKLWYEIETEFLPSRRKYS